MVALRNRPWLLFVLCQVFIPGDCASAPVGPSPADISEGIGKLAGLKSESEQWTRRLKRDYLRGSAEFKKAETLYIPAKRDLDRWIESLKADLNQHRKVPSSEYQESLKKATASGNAYVLYVNELYVKGVAAQTLVLIGDLVKSLPDIAYKITKDYQDRAAKRDEDAMKKIVDQLTSLKWDSFDKI